MKVLRVALLCVVVVAVGTSIVTRIRVLGYDRDQAIAVISTARERLILCYEIAREADRFGADTRDLLEKLTPVADSLFRASLALDADEFDTAVSFAARADDLLEDLIADAIALKERAQQRQYLDLFGVVFGSAIGAMIVLFGSLLIWRVLQARPERFSDRLEEHRPLFMGAVGVLLFLTISPTLGRFLSVPHTDMFTEFWVLGPSQRAQSYPFNITSGRQYRVFLGIGNRLGSTSYYKVAVKLINHTSSGPDGYLASGFPADFNKTFFVAEEGVVEHLIAFSFDYALNQSSFQIDVKTFTLNEVVIDMSGRNLKWDSEMSGFMGYLLFELWAYDQTSGAFEYHDRFLRLALNFTISGLPGSGL